MKNHKSQLQNIWENLAYQSKIFFKSYDLSIWIQIMLLWLPILVTVISFYLSSKTDTFSRITHLLDYISFTLSILALIYYAYFWKNTELYKSWWENYLVLYKEVENYFKINSVYSTDEIERIVKKQNDLWIDVNKPNKHFLSKYWTDWVIENEMRYANEKDVWWK